MKIAFGGGLIGREAICQQQGLGILKQLAKKHDVELIHKELHGWFDKFHGNFDLKDAELCIFNGHPNYMPELAKQFKKIINIFVFETTVPKDIVNALNIPEIVEIWTVSEFCKQLMVESGVRKPIRVIYLGVDERIFPTRVNLFPKDKSFKFLNVSAPHAIGKKDRKGVDVLVNAFKEEFGDDPNITLILKVNTIYADKYAHSKGKIFSIHEYIKSLLPKGTKLNNIAIIDKYFGYDQFNALYNSVHCGVFPSRAEGLSLCNLELIKVGRPVITTMYSAMIEYSDPRLMIKVDKMAPLDTNEFPYYDSLFAEPSKEHLKLLMRQVYENYQTELKKAEEHSKKVVANFTWDEVGKRIDLFFTKL